MGYLTMSDKERKQMKVFELLKQQEITQTEAAAKLRLSTRWVRKKYKRYKQLGDAGLVHLNRGKPSSRKLDQATKDLLNSLLQDEWKGFGPTFAAQKLEEIHQIKTTHETVRRVMIEACLWVPKRAKRKHRKRRERKPMFGMMIQLDGSPHDWFEGRAPKCTLLVYIDDATSKILMLSFAKGESEAAVMQSTKDYVQQFGIPCSFYTDHGSVFHVNLNNQEGDKKTQWEMACRRLGIEIHHAHSPQAKGRVERCNKTLQDRLIKEMRLAGISSIESANHYLRTSNFITQHNKMFAIDPLQAGDAHASAHDYNLDDVFTIRETRTLANDFTIQYNKQIYQLLSSQRTILRPKDRITVRTYLNGSIKLWIRSIELFFTLIPERVKKPAPERTVALHTYVKPSENSRRSLSNLFSRGSRVKPAKPAAEAMQNVSTK